ncbi:DUF2490 domain-containing protein [Flammeovirga sp. EKP202]|uniref:DUF2490 domain-containing protein n=1 Tax=Flammeovirga sp. EKP202 TaxID=2770592 RepID=UPI00165F9CA8|nr:DUF2490 domain-containing protein [Flammeovirga sp. EKP202]MBD0401411.1 DUF2490 domain-containing protein [Flammeovirga sp. EKP202]
MTSIKKVITSLSFLLVFIMTDNKVMAQDHVLWLHYFNSYKLSYRLSVDSDIGYRSDLFGFERWQYRSGLRYDLSNNLHFRAGLLYLHGPTVVGEIRPYQDIILRNRINRISFTNRVRLEQQFFEGNSNHNIRLRYNPSVSVPTIFGVISLGVEPFINLNDPNGPQLTSNRTLIGVKNNVYKNTFLTLQLINERSFPRNEEILNESWLIRVKIDHTIKPLKVNKLFERKNKGK